MATKDTTARPKAGKAAPKPSSGRGTGTHPTKKGSPPQPKAFAPAEANSVLERWYRAEGKRDPKAADTLGETLRLAQRVAEGFPTRAVDDVMRVGLIEPAVMYDIVVPRRTLADRKQKRKPLSPSESDRLARVLRVYARAREAIGDMTRAFRWLHKANRALGDMRPVDLLGSDAGARAVEKVLGRIEHGIVS